MKKCKRCNEKKHISDFGKRMLQEVKINSICKECRNIEAKLYRRRKGLERGVIVEPPKRKNINAVSKICTKCLTSKDINNFALDKTSSDGRSSSCGVCRNKEAKKYRKNNSEKIKEKEKGRYIKRGEHQRAYAKNRRKIESVRLAANKRQREQYKSNPIFIARHRFHSLLHRTLKATNRKKDSATYKLLGYTPQELKNHIESGFKEGMTWSNRGDWHIDHIKPIAQFIKEDIIDPAIINALDNLQPLWAVDNLSKGSRYEKLDL